MALNPKTSVLIRGRTEGTQRLREGQVKTEAEIGVMLPKASACREPPEAGRGKEGLSPRVFGPSVDPPTP